MCTDPELSKRFREVKTDELERATASDTRAMMVNSNNRFGKRNQGTGIKTCYRCNKKGHTSEPIRRSFFASIARQRDMHPTLQEKQS